MLLFDGRLVNTNKELLRRLFFGGMNCKYSRDDVYCLEHSSQIE